MQRQPEQALVTILAVDTVDSTRLILGREPDDAGEALDAIMKHIDAAVTENGGFLASFNGDGGLAVFGWPNPRENHADLAYSAARTIVGKTQFQIPHGWDEPLSPRFRLGIHSGVVGFRELELSSGSHLDLVGAVVHIAARLQKVAAPGTIAVSAVARRLMQEAAGMSPQDPGAIAGLVPGPVYVASGRSLATQAGRSQGARLRGRDAPRIIGRQDELQQLLAARERQEGTVLLAGVVGEPGVGKTRLAREFAEMVTAETPGRSFHFAKGDVLAQATPYNSFACLIRSAADPDRAAPLPQLVDRIERAGLNASERSAAISVIAPDNADHQRDWSAVELQRNLISALFKLDPAESGLIVVDDYHHLDRESRECIRRASQSARPEWTILLVARTEAGKELDDLCRISLRLQPLSTARMDELARTLYVHGSLQQAAVEEAIARAEGIPLILEQIIASLKTAPDDTCAKLPDGIHSLVHARLQLVSPHARLLAQSLSLLGGMSDHAVLADMMNEVTDDITPSIAELESFAILAPWQSDQVAFRHAIICDACATTAPRKLRERIHMRAVEALERHVEVRSQHAERLAHHAEAANQTHKALDYYWQAAVYARRTFSLGSLSVIFSNAVRLTTAPGSNDPVRFVDFVLMACTALLQGGEFDLIRQHLPRAAELAEVQMRPAKVSAALASMATIDWFDGRYREAEIHARGALATARRINHLPLIVAAETAHALALHGQSRMDEAIGQMRELRDMLSGNHERLRLGATATASLMVRSFLAWFLIDIGACEEGRDEALYALSLARELEDDYAQTLALSSLGSNLLAMGETARAVDCFRSALDLSILREYETIIPSLAGRLACAMARHGDAEAATRLVAAHEKPHLLERTGKAELFYFHHGKGEALCAYGQTGAGLEALGKAIHIARSVDNRGLIAHGLAARIRLMSGIDPGHVSIAADRDELAGICKTWGLKIA